MFIEYDSCISLYDRHKLLLLKNRRVWIRDENDDEVRINTSIQWDKSFIIISGTWNEYVD